MRYSCLALSCPALPSVTPAQRQLTSHIHIHIAHTRHRCHQVVTCTYDHVTVKIREGPLGDGLGVRVWAIAHATCRELAAHPESVRGLDVLEIGAGTGLCGIVAAKLGARRVVRVSIAVLLCVSWSLCVAVCWCWGSSREIPGVCMVIVLLATLQTVGWQPTDHDTYAI